MEQLEHIVAERRTYQMQRNTHAHPYAQLILPLQGELSIRVEEQQMQLDHQTLCFIPPTSQHTFHAAARNEFLVLDIPSFLLTGQQQKGLYRGGPYPFHSRWKGIRTLILDEIAAASSAPCAALKELYPYMSHYLRQDMMPVSLRYIHDHYDQTITVQQLADMEHYHRSHYAAWFRKETGKSPAAYIQNIRMQKAKQLLRDTDLPLLHIAVQVGFEHQSSFTRLFQQYEKQTPSQYRKQARL